MIICKYCQSSSFDGMKICYGCLKPLDDNPISVPQNEPLHVEPISLKAVTASTSKPDVPASQTVVKVTEAITLPKSSAYIGSPGMARLRVKMPQGYHYDVYLEKPEGASIQIGWVPGILPDQEDKEV